MQSSDIRKIFLKYYEGKGHKILPGSSLVPADPTVLLTLAGMLQFKPIFLGLEKPAYRRAATVQKCLRTNDIERVGKTPRHHTFFEMLGNFSFGDYFKKEAIQYAWELLTQELKLDTAKLRIAVYEKDDEAYQIWEQNVGVPKEIIFRLGEDNNFWAAGPTGPCGPCSEIYFDLGHEHGCRQPNCQPGCDCDRFLEIWNLVFIQFNRNEKGELIPLKQTGIDTGMGLERIAAVLQGVVDNYETDLFLPLIKKVKSLTTKETLSQEALKIIADHARAITHMVSDGIAPENIGRGYILRRLIRRAIRYGKTLGIDKPFIYVLAGEVISNMQKTYPELHKHETKILKIVKMEEENFFVTLSQGLKWFEEIALQHQQDKLISGVEAFKLHDTYGFPIDVTVEVAAENGLKVDLQAFTKEMDNQKERARRAGLSIDKKKNLLSLDLTNLPATNFEGYEKHQEEAKVIAVFPEQRQVVLDKTPFYGESGGQVGDTGILAWDKKEVLVVNTLISPKGTILHEVERVDGLKVGQKVKATIDLSKRQATEAHHTATHLLHQALRDVLGEQVKQAGSYVGPDKLRFDFNHSQGLCLDDLQKVEKIVNDRVCQKLKVEVLQKSYQEAVKMGAKALFGEKYGDKVRVLKIGDYSLELCGGTHVKSTGDILYFKIISEGALGSGIRRIEALAGQAAKVFVVYQAKSLYLQVEALIRRYRHLQLEKERLGAEKSLETNIFAIEITELDRIGKSVDCQDSTNVNKYLDHLNGRVDWLRERVFKAEKEIEALKINQIKSNLTAFIEQSKEYGGIKVLLKEFPGYQMDVLRQLSDSLQAKMGSCVLLLVSTGPDKVSFLLTVTQDLATKGLSAKVLGQKFAEIIQGKCGGKETKAEGGGKEPQKVPQAFKAVEGLLCG